MKTSGLLHGIAGLAMLTLAAATPADQAKPTPGESMLDPTNHTMILIDHQPQMAFATRSIDIVELRNNVTGLAKAAKAFDAPTILTTVKVASASVLDGIEVDAPSLIVHNARVTTQNPAQPNAQAVAVRDGLVYKVGGDAEILALRDKQTLVIDARQRRLIPGLNDSHTHVVRGGRFYNLELRWEGVPSLEIGLEMIREQAKRTPEGQWVRVIGGWSPYQFREKRFPTVAELNAAAPDTPVFVLFLYSRGFLNKAGMEALGITAATKPPPNDAGDEKQ